MLRTAPLCRARDRLLEQFIDPLGAARLDAAGEDGACARYCREYVAGSAISCIAYEPHFARAHVGQRRSAAAAREAARASGVWGGRGSLLGRRRRREREQRERHRSAAPSPTRAGSTRQRFRANERDGRVWHAIGFGSGPQTGPRRGALAALRDLPTSRSEMGSSSSSTSPARDRPSDRAPERRRRVRTRR